MSQPLNYLGQPIGFDLDGWKAPPPPSREFMAGRYCSLEPLDSGKPSVMICFRRTCWNPDGSNWTYLPYGPFETLESYLAWMDEICVGTDPLFFAVVDNSTGKAVGVASYLRIFPTSGSIEVGHINYSPLLQKTLAATEAMYLMMKNAFELGYRRYEWKCDALNAGSRSAAQRLGLSFEGVFRQATLYKGRNRDTSWYATIDVEWPALEEAFLQWLDPSNFDEEGQQRISLSDLTAPILKQRG